jgi:pimeloyl-ACP methyl ester carboxylesterase
MKPAKTPVSDSKSANLLHDLGGEGPVIHLAHANGFPPGTYDPLGEVLAQNYHVVGLPARPLWPNSLPEHAPTWHTLADDLIEGLNTLGLSDIIGVGHSLGGVCTMLAAVQSPDLFRVLVLIDPVILPPIVLWVLKLTRMLGLGQRQPLVRSALRRRRIWPSRQACFEHYRAKQLFSPWSDRSLWAYVKAGTRFLPDGQVELVYPLQWEAHIFATAPTDVWRYVAKLTTPTLVIRGERSDTFRPQAQQRMARLAPQTDFHVISNAGHLVPMERPTETGAIIQAYLSRHPQTKPHSDVRDIPE